MTKAKILIVDDSELFLNYTRMSLRKPDLRSSPAARHLGHHLL